MSMSNSEARKRAVENAVQAMKAEVWDEAASAHIAAREAWHDDTTPTERMYWPDVPNPYRSEAGR